MAEYKCGNPNSTILDEINYVISMKKVLVIVLAMLFPGAGIQHQEIQIYQVERDGYIEVFGKNPNQFPVTIELDIAYKNLQPSRQLPFEDVLNARSDRKLMQLDIPERNVTWEFNTTYSYYMGNIFARHDDDYAYRLPYRKGSSQRVAQGYNGSFTHTDRIRYSLDFDLKENTEVYAARDGLVIEIETKYDEGGEDESYMNKANFITILHSDGTFADYSHLRQGGAVVQLNQRVRAGQLIGYSGATGYVTGPHLHFNVKKTSRGGSFETLPVKFKTDKGTIQLQQGQSYTAF